MSAVLLDGTKIAREIRAELFGDVQGLTAAGLRPGLAVVLVGHNPASEVYVRGKVKSCEELGIYSEKLTPPVESTTEELCRIVESLNRRDEIDGILVQLPLPDHVDAKKVLLTVDPAKDVDGFHPVNVGYLSTQRPGFDAVTNLAVSRILRRRKFSPSLQRCAETFGRLPHLCRVRRPLPPVRAASCCRWCWRRSRA